MVQTTKKHCPRCDKMRGVEEFGKDVTRKDGRRVWCRPCVAAYVHSRTKKALRAREPKVRGKHVPVWQQPMTDAELVTVEI